MSDELLDVIAAPIRECFGADSPHEHVAMRITAALKASRHEVVKLPEADDTAAGPDFGEYDAYWDCDSMPPNFGVYLEGGRVTWSAHLHASPATARKQAAGLLAAANASDAADGA